MVEGKIYSWTDLISDHRLQRSKYGSNCARSSEQQDMLALGYFVIPENIVVRGDRKPRLKICCKKNRVNFFPHPSKGKTIVVPLPLVLPTSPYRTAAVVKFG